MKPVTIVAGVAITAFVVDRIVTAVLFLLSYFWKQFDPALLEAEERAEAQRTYKLVYFSMATALAVCAYHFVFAKQSVFAVLEFQPNHMLDAIVTTLLIVAGAERVAALLKVPEAEEGAESPPPPIQVAGSVTLVPDHAVKGKTAAG